MKTGFHLLLAATLFLGAMGARGPAAVTVQVSVDPQELGIGDEANVTYAIKGGSVDDFQLPNVDGLTLEGQSTSAQFVMNNLTISQSVAHTFLVVPNRAGTLTIPAFDLHTGDGHTLRTQPVTLHVLTGSNPGSFGPPPSSSSTAPTPGDNAAAAPSPPPTTGRSNVPTDSSGRPLPVFDIITPETTTAYVGQAVPLRIESFINAEANAQQDSLPTLVGSDFLMNNLSLRPSEQGVNVGDEEYIRDSWLTAISAPKAGDFPLQAVRDTYWNRVRPGMVNDPFGPLFGQPSQLVHKEISSNQMVMHILPLPAEGKPAGFTGAIGKFQVTGTADPTTVAVGEPVSLHFVVTGTGNFDYVRSPALAPEPAWRAYVPSSKMDYAGDESHTQGTKTFEQAVIPQKNGAPPLPAANFSYFDPDKKQYVTLPIALPTVVVTGAPPPMTASTPAVDLASVAPTPIAASTDLAPNQLGLGSTSHDLAPAYRHAWFWVVQGALILIILAGLAGTLSRPAVDPARGLRAKQAAALQREEEAMDRAARAGDAMHFFGSARRALQLRLGLKWNLPPESVTLPEIARRDPTLAENLSPLFAAADDVIYSGAAGGNVDLAEWNRRVREMLQPARL